jgi:hypothetical protein
MPADACMTAAANRGSRVAALALALAGLLSPPGGALAEVLAPGAGPLGTTESRIAFDGAGRYVDFFAAPTTEGGRVDFVRNGDRVTVRPGKEGWMQVMGRHESVWRWVPEALVHPPVADRLLRLVDVSDLDLEGIPVMEAPDVNARPLRLMPNGTMVEIVARRPHFVLVEGPGRRLQWLVNFGLVDPLLVEDDKGATPSPPRMPRP